ncbi:MAG TPA: tRNA pseudouridine(55) synthase TruB [Pyrinomonadaceae bacterium]|nr:tRNA pseudouridine(55) synthase TruB [Pyrinomonadaceae bacterium]
MNGVLIIDKPAGWTSHDVVARVRRVLGVRRVGHTGTLDPFATGVLVVLVGRATRLAQYLAGAQKEYDALVRFGYATETGDLTGARREQQTLEEKPCAGWSREEVERALEGLRGEIEQVPPMYSAKKVQGRKLYELARRGEQIERKAVRVNVAEFEIVPDDADAWLRRNEDGTCDLRARVVCSAGTYVRVLAEDLGARLGTGAHLAALRRTRAGAFHIAQAVHLEQLAELAAEKSGASELLTAPDAALPELPFVHLTAEEARRVRHGAAVEVAPESRPNWREGEHVRLRDGAGNLIAVGVYVAARAHVQPRVMLCVEDEK